MFTISYFLYFFALFCLSHLHYFIRLSRINQLVNTLRLKYYPGFTLNIIVTKLMTGVLTLNLRR